MATATATATAMATAMPVTLVRSLVAVVGLIAFPTLARAEGPDSRDVALPCRPTIACMAEIVPAGSFEVESGVLYRRIGTRGHQWTAPFLLKQSFTNWFQLQVGTNGYSINRGAVAAQYLDDLGIGPKFVLWKQTKFRPSFAVSGQFNVPTFRRTGYLRTYDALFTGYISKDIGFIHADINLGANFWRLEGKTLPQELYDFAVQANFPPFAFVAETYVYTDAAPVALRDGGLLLAVSQSPKSWLILDEGGDIGFYPSTRAFSLFIGATFIPEVFWRPDPEEP